MSLYRESCAVLKIRTCWKHSSDLGLESWLHDSQSCKTTCLERWSKIKKKLKFNFIEYGIIKPFSQTIITQIKPVILLSLIISIFTITVLMYVVVNVLKTCMTFHFTIFSRVNTLTWVIYKNCIKTQKFISLSLNVRRSFSETIFYFLCCIETE